MVSAPDTNCTSRHSSPASASAPRAAAIPYSTKLRPHLPHGCMPTPSTATRPVSATPVTPRGRGNRAPLPHQVLVVVVLVQHVGDEVRLGAHREVLDTHARHDLAHHDHLLVGQLHR